MSTPRIPPLGADGQPMLTPTQEHAANWRARAEIAEIAVDLLRKVANYWEGRPVEHHGHHIYADIRDVLRAITPATPIGGEGK